ncbi:MAG TPA: DUF6153 family protein [Nocardioidaceae bacterium]|nr:DUF6153 family protein [Nocardioidaceae bacterium]
MRLAVLVVSLLGLFGMHGLSDHGVAHASSHAVVAMSDHASHAGHTAPVPEPSAPAPSTPSDDHGAGLLVVCLAVLAGAVSLAIAVLLAARRRPSLRLSAGQWTATTRPRRARDPVPPDIWRLSVQRC